MTPLIGITQENALKTAQILSGVLADEVLLYIKTRNAHWNVEDADFYNQHKFYEEQYEQLDDIMDEVAERIRTLGHYAPATMKDYLQLTHLTELSRDTNDGQGFMHELLGDHESIIVHLRANIGHIAETLKDAGTSDFITQLLEKHEKMAWMLRSHLKKIPVNFIHHFNNEK
ncbi:Dps family protein [Niastella sp. OAS944]|uniref:Dps family protein n=1 Tax=Niastella sp. OAS944 TaxID=2664089 RepID=UPI003493A289|nr:starvation-inducible DNA-binding protein [Chitinophagaceae bacterium OAS944]